jgi:hypothetical protein
MNNHKMNQVRSGLESILLKTDWEPAGRKDDLDVLKQRLDEVRQQAMQTLAIFPYEGSNE